ncbi:hypothetical protein K438DRAFT_1943025, partial [Mycena galopus ATCC 62051]
MSQISPETLALALQFVQQMQQPLATQPAPQPGSSANGLALPITSYTSTRPPRAGIPLSAWGHPNPTTAALPSAILGSSSLAVLMAANLNQPRQAAGSRSRLQDRPTRSEISEANQGRNEAIDSHFPLGPSLPPRGRRRNGRGRAQATPTLVDDSSLASALQTDSLSNQQFIHIEVHVYLPTTEPNASVHLVHRFPDSFPTFLDNNSLRFLHRLPVETSIVTLIHTVARDMADSPKKWVFSEPSYSFRQQVRDYEVLHLQLLALSNRGIPRRTDNLITLTRVPINNQLTLVVAQSGITGLTKIGPTSGSHLARRHSCLPQFMHSVYSAGNETGETSSQWSPPPCDSGGETDEEMEVDDMLFDSDSENLPPTPTPVQPTPPAMQPPAPVMQAATSTSALASATPTAAVLLPIPTPRIQTHPTSSLALPIPSETSATQNSLPVPSSSSQSTGSGLWATTWVPIPGRYRAVFQSEDFVKSIFETASSNRAPSTLVISGRNIPELSMCLVTKCKEAAARRDFSEIMAADQVYNLLNDDGSLLSTGVGIGREAIWTAFYCYVQHGGQWFLTRFEGKCSVATTMPLASSGLVNADRRINLMVLGCLAALLLIHGIAPEPLSPCLIQWAANQCDVRSLTREFIGEWHPELKALLDRWISAGPAGDIRSFAQHFATFHDIQASQKLISLLLSIVATWHNTRPLASTCCIPLSLDPSLRPTPSSWSSLLGSDFPAPMASTSGRSFGLYWFYFENLDIGHTRFGSIEPYLIMFTPSRSAIRQFVESATNPILAMDLPSMLQNFLQTLGVPCSAELDEGKSKIQQTNSHTNE